MNTAIPLYIEQIPSSYDSFPTYKVTPLFFEYAEFSDEKLQRAINKLVKSLTTTLEISGRDFFQEQIANFLFAPEIEDHFLKLKLELAKRMARANFLFVVFKGLKRRLVFTPSIPDFWFELPKGIKLQEHATEILSQYFRKLEKKEGDEAPTPESLSVAGKAWTTTIDIHFQLHTPREKKEETRPRASIGCQTELDGAEELRKVARCLNWLYPDDLERVLCREQELEELTKLINNRDRRPILLVGPRMVGKTALIHEYVYQTIQNRKLSPFVSRRSIWLISPQRLISGMSYVGQWENRLLAILKTAKKDKMILYFDDLIGLFHAGVTSKSDLSVADVIKPLLEKREFRMLAEITPEALRVLQERDRAFADFFQILPIKETSTDQTLKILIRSKRNFEFEQKCKFALEALPTATNLQERYVRNAVFPGKAVHFLKQLSIKYCNNDISREDVLKEFQAKSGLSLKFLDDTLRLSHQEITSALSKEIIGQPLALEAAADAITLTKAKLNDPDRPIATFLFLGPTGVGKTQCAKALAKYIFGDAERLIRFDMNEFITPDALTRLVGTFRQPEGLLTSAIRRQPFSVLLLDEIEKADSDVFNLLLQVLGEGRLTDATGNTVDFTNVLLIMTSNLGVKEANTQLGFQQNESSESAIYLQAVQRFFRPEFFNRIDRVIPFRKLSRSDMGSIAKLLIQNVFSREGLLRRKCLLNIDPQAMEKIIDEGYNPIFGARALKRTIERQITQPVATQLLGLQSNSPTVINIYPGKENIVVHIEGLKEPSSYNNIIAKVDLKDTKTKLKQIETALVKLENAIDKLAPKGAIDPSNVTPEIYQYFQLRDQARRVNAICRNLSQRLNSPKKPTALNNHPKTNRTKFTYKEINLKQCVEFQGIWQRLFEEDDIHQALKEIAKEAITINREIDDQLAEALREFALLQLMFQTDISSSKEVIIYIHSLIPKLEDKDHFPQKALQESYLRLFNNKLGVLSQEFILNDNNSSKDRAILVKAPHALLLAQLEAGTHLFIDESGQLNPVEVRVFDVTASKNPIELISTFNNKYNDWLSLFSDGQVSVNNNPAQLQDVIRVYEEEGLVFDLKSGLIADLRDGEKRLTPFTEELHIFLLDLLPYPKL
ncbi:MAG: ATP-dependent Clp protease ATP-binding subunit [Acidobacteria bacterium]|nr:ATP-dependent Clp protease ATP-binding subunit [Acidobacteriota bacterium]